MLKVAGAILAGLFVVQGGLPSLGLEEPVSNIAALAVGTAIAALSYLLKGTEPAS